MLKHPATHKYEVQVYKYEPDGGWWTGKGTWTTMPELSTERHQHTAMLANSSSFYCLKPPSYIKKT